MTILSELSEHVQKGRIKNVKALTEQALAENIPAKIILTEGLQRGMLKVSETYKKGKIFVPEVLMATMAINAGIAILEPELSKTGAEPVGKAVIGTVEGDLHEIGKNLVMIMMRGVGFEVFDLGIDVSPETFVDKAEEMGADVICMSALLTTTMQNMKQVTDLLEKRGLRQKYIVMVGGAPVNDNYAKEIGADFYTENAAEAAETARRSVLTKKQGLK